MSDTTNGRIHAIETCGTVDGPGIRYVIFTQGCPLRCAYCHNPDTWAPNGGHKVMSVRELLGDIVKYKSYFRFSGGGVTLSGGEPLMQKEFAAALFREVKREGLHTALDTAGYADIDGGTKEVLRHTDLVLLDVKSINPETFKQVTAKPIDKTLALARYLSDNAVSVWARFVLVPGLTDNQDEIHALGQYLATLRNIERVSVLPFHQLGANKWEALKMRYTLKDTPTPTDEETNRVRALLRGYGFVVS